MKIVTPSHGQLSRPLRMRSAGNKRVGMQTLVQEGDRHAVQAGGVSSDCLWPQQRKKRRLDVIGEVGGDRDGVSRPQGMPQVAREQEGWQANPS